MPRLGVPQILPARGIVEGGVTRARIPFLKFSPEISAGSWSCLEQEPGRGAQPRWFWGFCRSQKGHGVGDKRDVGQPQMGRVTKLT